LATYRLPAESTARPAGCFKLCTAELVDAKSTKQAARRICRTFFIVKPPLLYHLLNHNCIAPYSASVNVARFGKLSCRCVGVERIESVVVLLLRCVFELGAAGIFARARSAVDSPKSCAFVSKCRVAESCTACCIGAYCVPGPGRYGDRRRRVPSASSRWPGSFY
jgi:hypothetical protein